MFIKDLEVSKELSRKELAGVRGGFNIGIQGGQYVAQGSLLNFGSPVTAVNAPSMTNTYTEVDINSLSAVGSLVLAAQGA